MSLRVIGAGLGRTGTNSLKVALEQLLGGRCFHMLELFERPSDTAVWHRAVRGEPVDWDALFVDFTATVDWPACAFWSELHGAYPDAVVLLSTRRSAQEWWQSMESTILANLRQPVPPNDPERAERRTMLLELLDTRFTRGWSDRSAAIAAYESHNEAVRRAVAPGQLLEWCPGDDWEPICAALDVLIPRLPFPHTNTSADFRSRMLSAPEKTG
jgi:Sulfotransferase domain